jgi:hypothetical protein
VFSKWLTANKLAKRTVIKFITNNWPQYALNIGYNEIPWFTNWYHWNWKNRTDQVLPKLRTACHAVRLMFHISNTDTLKSIDFACFCSIMKYGIVLGVMYLEVKWYLLHERELLESCLVPNPETHAEVCLREKSFYLFHVNICIFINEICCK